jgi:serine/threonine protein kinase
MISVRKLRRKNLLKVSVDVGGVEYIRRDELEVIRLIGEGGFATVFEVFHKQSSLKRSDPANGNGHPHPPSHYAMKVVRQGLQDDKYLQRKSANDLVNEAKVLALLNHPNIVKLRALPRTFGGKFAIQNEFFLVLDLLTDTLSQRIQRWKIEDHDRQQLLPWKVDYAYQMAAALQYLHSKHILFRDLKPENVGFKDQHTVQLFDFGLARQLRQGGGKLKTLLSFNSETTVSSYDTILLQEETFKMTRCGTQRYSSPEAVLCGRVCLKSDSYAFGLVFWEMLMEMKPFHYMTPSVHKILVCERGERPPIDQNNLPCAIGEILKECWEEDICDRLSMTQVFDRLHVFLESTVIIGRPNSRFKCRVPVDLRITRAEGLGGLNCGHEIGIEVAPIWLPAYFHFDGGDHIVLKQLNNRY